LIMLIVFLAVPALQRNSRNTQYKNDAANYASAVSEWMNNNNGKLPSSSADMTAVKALSNLGQLTAPASANALSSGSDNATVAIGSIKLDTNAKCSTDTAGQADFTATRAAAVRYAVEDSKGNAVLQCVDV